MSRNYDRDRYRRRFDEDDQTSDRAYERSRYGRESRYGRSSDEPRERGYRGRGPGWESDYASRGRGYYYGLDYDREFGTTGSPTRRGYDYERDYDTRDLGSEYGQGRSYGRGSGYTPRTTGPVYGREGMRGRYYGREEDRDYESEGESYYGRGQRGSYGYGGEYGGRQRDYDRDYDREYDRDYERGEREERGWWERTADEVRSWFGDEEAERRRSMDEARSGKHRGRGPRGYRRSDDRIKEDINDRLTDHPFLDASDIDVEVNNGEVTLSGKVDGRNDKRIAEDIAEEVSGVTNVENRLRIRQSRWGAASPTEERATTAETLRTTQDREAAATTTTTGSSGRKTG